MEKFRLYGSSSPAESRREIEHRALARRAAAEGMVLLKNDGLLPLTEKKIALYGAGARMTVRGGTGSGDMRERYSISIEQGLKNAGFEIPNTKWLDRFDHQYYKEKEVWRAGIEQKIKWFGPFRIQKMFNIIHSIPFRFTIGDRIQADELTREANTAIFVVARQAGESNDRRLEKGDFLLADVEYENIKTLAAHYQNLLLVINCGGLIDLSRLDDIPNISAILFFVQGGMEGGNAFADLVSGKVTPSGKLVDTWGKNYADYPSADTYSYLNGNLDDEDYREGIYVGYRFFDSFDIAPHYEFGYGLSYTTFEQRVTAVSVDRFIVTLQVDVTNTGHSYAGKEVVQSYLEKPSGRLDHERRSLAAFAKTDLLSPGEQTNITLSFDLHEQASYDIETACWFLEAGEYGLSVGASSRNNVPAAVIVLEQEIVTEKAVNVCPLQRDFTDLKSHRSPGGFDLNVPRVFVRAETVECVTHSYEKPERNENPKVQQILSKLSDEELAALCVGGGEFGSSFNYTPGAAGRTTTTLLKKGIPNINFSDGPAGLNVIPELVITKSGSMRYLNGLPESWNWGFLRKISRFLVAKPGQGRPVYQYMTAWPAVTLQAQTWDVALLKEIGSAIGREMLEIGVTLWLAPGMNIHRNPLCGRNFEYYSEDPLLSGKMAAAITRGVQSQPGVGVTMKHFCCNNQEDNRENVSANVSERALREIYLRGFRCVVSEARPMALMTSYNKVNGVYTANSADLLTKVLRNEWGFQGLVMTDWGATGDGKGVHEFCPATGNDLIMPGSKTALKTLIQALKAGRLDKEDVKRSAAKVLQVIFSSAVVEGF